MSTLKFEKYTISIVSLVAFSLLSANVFARDWSGMYMGIHAGYGFNNLDGIFDSAGSEFPLDDLDGDGGIAGAQLGVNFQHQNWVYGVEASLSPSWIEEEGGPDSEGDRHKFETDWLATLLARAGIVHRNILFYLAAGAAYHDSTLTVEIPDDNDKFDMDSFGGAFGGGAEYSPNDTFGIKAEFLYLLFNDDEIIPDSLEDADTGDNIELNDTFMFRIGLNYYF